MGERRPCGDSTRRGDRVAPEGLLSPFALSLCNASLRGANQENGPMVRHALAAALAGMLAVQAAPIRAQEEAVTYYDFTKTPGAPYGPFTEMRAVVTGSNSFAYATVPN